MTVPTISRRILASRSKHIIIAPFSAAAVAHPSAISTDGAVRSVRSYSQYHSYHDSKTFAWAAVTAAAGASLLGIASSSQHTRCESAVGTNPDSSPEEDTEPEIDPYDNLPEEDEPTHCSICLTYRQGPCRPYWRKVEACTKDGEKDRKKTEESEDNKGNKDSEGDDNDEESSSPMESTRCFKYMMPWIDCASQYRNLYTLIEMDTNYTEGIQELEATSRHFCWLPGKEPTIDWSNWEQSGDEKSEIAEPAVAAPIPNDNDDDDTSKDNVPLWKTLDPALGDPKFISIEAKVPPTINEGLGILECAYALDQDNNVIGFAYGTKPSELMKEEDAGESGGNQEERKDNNSDEENKSDDDETVTTAKDKMVTLNIRLVESRTRGFVLAASYTHRIEGAKSTEKGETNNNTMGLESHLYKSKPFALADVPKLSPQEEQ